MPGLWWLCASSVGLVDLSDRSSFNTLLEQGLEGELGTQAVDGPLLQDAGVVLCSLLWFCLSVAFVI